MPSWKFLKLRKGKIILARRESLRKCPKWLFCSVFVMGRGCGLAIDEELTLLESIHDLNPDFLIEILSSHQECHIRAHVIVPS